MKNTIDTILDDVVYGWNQEKLNEQYYNESFNWLVKHLSTPHKKGSDLPVCKWALDALESEKFHVGDAREMGADIENLRKILDEMIRLYKDLGTFETYKGELPPTLTVLLHSDTSLDSIISILNEYRDKYTPEKLMVGALDPYNKLRSLRGGDGCPYSSPYNFFTIRWMVRGDITFLNLNETYKNIYKDTFKKKTYEK